MKNISLRQLKIFEAVARHLNYTRAAEEFFLTQPAVSMQVKQLEEQLGLALFEQLGKRIHLTEAGKEVLAYARTIGQQLDEMETVLNRMKGMQGGRLRISVATTANYFIPVLLGSFSRNFPDVTISLDVTNRETLLRQLGENTVDLVIMGQPPVEADVEAEAFKDNPLVVVAPLDHPLAGKKRSPSRGYRKKPSSCANPAPAPASPWNASSTSAACGSRPAWRWARTKRLSNPCRPGSGSGCCHAPLSNRNSR